MSNKFKKLARKVSAKTGVSHAGAVNQLRREKPHRNTDAHTILDYAESQGIRLTPVQRFLVKLYEGLELDSNGHCHETLSERQYLRYLYNEGRSNTGDQIFCRENVFVLGRRSGKSVLSGLISGYEMQRLIALRESLDVSQSVKVMSISYDKAEAGWLFAQFTASPHMKRLLPLVVSNSVSAMKFKIGGKLAQLSFSTNNSKALRGGCSFALIFNDSAHFTNASETYAACTPTTEALKGRIVTLSSPGYIGEKVHTLYNKSDVLALRIPCYHANPAFTDLSASGLPEWQANFVERPSMALPDSIIQQMLDMYKTTPEGLLKLVQSYSTGESKDKRKWASQIFSGAIEHLEDPEVNFLVTLIGTFLEKLVLGPV